MDVVAEYGRQILSLLLVFSLLAVTVWKLGRARTQGLPLFRSSQKPARALQARERLSLTPQHTLHVVELRGREILVATHPHGVTVLDPGSAQAIGRGA